MAITTARWKVMRRARRRSRGVSVAIARCQQLSRNLTAERALTGRRRETCIELTNGASLTERLVNWRSAIAARQAPNAGRTPEIRVFTDAFWLAVAQRCTIAAISDVGSIGFDT